MTIATVLFDLGDVVCHFRPKQRLQRLTAATGLAESVLQQTLWASGFSEACDRGELTAAEMYTRAGELLNWQSGYTVFRDLWAAAFEPNDAVLRLVDTVQSHASTGLLTNNPYILLEALPHCLPDVHRRFESVLFSCQFGVLKPSAALFHGVLARLGQPAEKVLLIDDSRVNVAGARAVGMQACHFTSATALRHDLKRYMIAL